jgi:hypothetical protein
MIVFELKKKNGKERKKRKKRMVNFVPYKTVGVRKKIWHKSLQVGNAHGVTCIR